MNSKICFCVIALIISMALCPLKTLIACSPKSQSDDVQHLKDKLIELKNQSKNPILTIHFQSMLDVISAKGTLSNVDSSLLAAILPCFDNTGIDGSGALEESYINRQRQLVISWVSPTDGKTSFFRLKLPSDWDPTRSYPLYIELHGLWSVADNPIDFMTYAYRNKPGSSFAFQDGYYILPWGRGNLWYQGISETDIWEGINKIESLFTIDQSRKYLTGHSMGGYGAWSIASRSPEVWAAIGIHAGALSYGPENMLSDKIIGQLASIPTYFVVGRQDGLYNINHSAYQLLQQAGNNDIRFETFEGGHDYIQSNVENMYLWLRDYVNTDYLSYNPVSDNVNDAIFISPNPVRDRTNVEIHLKNDSHAFLSLYDPSGRLISTLLNKDMNQGVSLIPVERQGLPAGCYTLMLTTSRQKISAKLIFY